VERLGLEGGSSIGYGARHFHLEDRIGDETADVRSAYAEDVSHLVGAEGTACRDVGMAGIWFFNAILR
jgi:hypothetical protein